MREVYFGGSCALTITTADPRGPAGSAAGSARRPRYMTLSRYFLQKLMSARSEDGFRGRQRAGRKDPVAGAAHYLSVGEHYNSDLSSRKAPRKEGLRRDLQCSKA